MEPKNFEVTPPAGQGNIPFEIENPDGLDRPALLPPAENAVSELSTEDCCDMTAPSDRGRPDVRLDASEPSNLGFGEAALSSEVDIGPIEDTIDTPVTPAPTENAIGQPHDAPHAPEPDPAHGHEANNLQHPDSPDSVEQPSPAVGSVQRFDIVDTPTDEPPTLSEWEQRLDAFHAEGKIPLEGNRALMAKALVCVDQGIRFVNDTFRAKGVDIERPSITFVADADKAGLSARKYLFVNSDYPRHVLINPQSDFVKEFLGHPPGSSLEDITYSDEVNGTRYVLPVQDVLTLLGVEESHHDLYLEYRHARPSNMDTALDAGYAAYYAETEIEFQALRWRAMAARQLGMADETQQWQQAVLDAAKEIRRGRLGHTTP